MKESEKRVVNDDNSLKPVKKGGSRLDHVYRSILQTKFFNKGWGKPDNLKRLFEFRKVMANRESCYQLVHKDYPVTITKENLGSDYNMLEGHLLSPFVTHLPGILPKEAEVAHFQVIIPKKWNSDHYKPICLHLAGTGDHGFWRRRQLMAKPLIKEAGIAAIILENPFYGLRKPKDQVRSNLHNVSDIFVMGGCLMLESLVLFHWCERNGYGPLGITGMSMGGHMASLAATNWPKPLVLVPCLSWSTASPVFTEGVMSSSIDWQLLQSQYFADEVFKEEINKMVGSGEYAFRAGQHFAKHYPQNCSKEVLTKWREDEALNFMRGIMDECTHLRNFDIPVDTSLIIAVCARKDAYVPREGCMSLTDIWPGAEVRYVNAGHVSAYLLYQHTFRAVEYTHQALDFDLYIYLLSG
uniref:Protein ABHD18 n=1 Tax=Timema cristinae TaxID=61476 RepID=A0A7R9GSQ9_TIMCR|nr:unnamed protein product [Timema cristinae]